MRPPSRMRDRGASRLPRQVTVFMLEKSTFDQIRPLSDDGALADALRLARDFADDGPIAVVLGDNIIEKDLRDARQAYERQGGGARLVLKGVPDPERFGVPVFEGGRLVGVQEKPACPSSNFAVTGHCFYDATVFEKIERCRPSQRRELEITDVNNLYLAEGRLEYSILNGWWSDAGTFASLLKVQNLVAQGGAHRRD